MKKITITLLSVLALSIASRAQTSPEKPNIVLILADDLGWGDLSCYGATTIDTPNIDTLARDGSRFTNVYAPMPICTPSRYGIMTGEHYFRAAGRNFSRGQLLIPPGTPCLPQMLQDHGYQTACFGKWHLGFGENRADWNGELKPGPLEIGFDYFYGNPVTHNEAPNVIAENHRVLGLDPDDPIILPRGWGAGKPTEGAAKAQAMKINENLGVDQTERVVQWLEDQKKDEPFFLYFATLNVHGPLTPNGRFRGKSSIGVYGDYLLELDWMVGEVLQTLEKQGLSDNTLVFFASDNGAIYNTQAYRLGHRSVGPLPGQKTDIWMGGCRVPLLARWPGNIPAGRSSDELLSLLDFYPAIAALLGEKLPDEVSIDGVNMLPELLDQAEEPVRESMIISGIPFSAEEKQIARSSRRGREPAALITRDWMYIPLQGSGGVSTRWEWGMKLDQLETVPTGHDAQKAQLYRLDTDPYQLKNVYDQFPEKAGALHARLEEMTRFTHKPRTFED